MSRERKEKEEWENVISWIKMVLNVETLSEVPGELTILGSRLYIAEKDYFVSDRDYFINRFLFLLTGS